MTQPLPDQSWRAQIIVFCPTCKQDLQRIPNAGNATNQYVPADTACGYCQRQAHV